MRLPSLPEVYRTVRIPDRTSFFRKFLAFTGPALLVSVGYMDPGNWATDLAGGSKYGFALLWVILASNLMAILLQTLCVRLGLVTGRDLAQACRDYYKKPAALALWVLCEVAIIACDLAEVIGSAVALNMLFGMPLVLGVLLTGFDVLALLLLMRLGVRKLEAVILTLVATIGICFACEIYMASPPLGAVLHGTLVPSLPDAAALYIALGILGATVMPHNLYLHSSLVQSRAFERTPDGIREAIKLNTLDTVLSLGAAFFVNAAILILSASVFHGVKDVTELQQAHELLTPMLGAGASTLFAVALLASGQSSTITGTLAGQIVMEGFLNLRMAPWLRRLITRSLAIVPAVVVIAIKGSEGTMQLLVLSQVVLSMQLPFAIFPLVAFTSSRSKMGDHVNPTWMAVLGFGVATLISALNIYLLYQTLGGLWVGLMVGSVVLFSLWVKYGYKGRPAADEDAVQVPAL